MTPDPPAWIHKRDGRLVPFEADKISRALFAATESLGRPDPFTARELADGVLHFLTADAEGRTPTTAQVAELVVKVVRELGHPELSRAFAEHGRRRTDEGKGKVPAGPSARRIDNPVYSLRGPGPAPAEPARLAWAAGAACLRAYALDEVFTRDLATAHADGLLTLGGLEAPWQLAAVVAGPLLREGAGATRAVEEASRLAGTAVALDGPEWELSLTAGGVGVGPLARELRAAHRRPGPTLAVNLNAAAAPAWADSLADGPLFGGSGLAPGSRPAAVADALLEHLDLTAAGGGPVTIHWHLGAADFAPPAAERLLRVARRAAEGQPLAFVFDRPRRPVALAEGLDRQHTSGLLTVGLHLPRFADQPTVRGNPPAFLDKLGSVVRLALSAAAQKRDFLRRTVAGWPAFLLARARLVLVPVGLAAAAAKLGSPALAQDAVKRLRDVAEHDGRLSRIDAAVDSAPAFGVTDDPALPPAEAVAGLTAWDPSAAPKSQLKAAGAWHAAAGGGTAAVLLPEGNPPTAEQVADWLRYAWEQTALVRVRLVRAAGAGRQLVAPWEETSRIHSGDS